MRIIAGSLRGRVFNSPRGHRTHPMSNKVRAALFNVLGDVAGLTILDAYSGSGAIGLEGISRGASHVTCIDSDKNATDAIRITAHQLNVKNQLKIITANVSTWSRQHPEKKFDVVVADPPYDAVKIDDLVQLTCHVGSRGLLVCSLPPKLKFELPDDCTTLSQKSYGDAELHFYRKN